MWYEQQHGLNRFIILQQLDRSQLDIFLRLDEEICGLEESCVGPRLITIEAWIKYLESKQNISPNDIIQLPLHMLDDEYIDDQSDEKYSRRARLKADVDSFAKVRQVCIIMVFHYVALHVQLSFLLMRAEKPYYHATMADIHTYKKKVKRIHRENIHVKSGAIVRTFDLFVETIRKRQQ